MTLKEQIKTILASEKSLDEMEDALVELNQDANEVAETLFAIVIEGDATAAALIAHITINA